jgi:pimeloyl-ACP methyl ester carboxylesterase
MEQEVRFCTASDGVRIAYATVGEGPPLVKTANWLNHLEFDWQSPLWQHWFAELSRDHRLIRYDERGNGLSDWDAEELSFEAFVRDLETVVDAAGVDRFDQLGITQGCAVSVAYAVRHPERVGRLVLYGGYTQGWARRESPGERERREAMVTLARQGWGQNNPAYRQLFTSLYIPGATREEMDWFNDLQRASTSPDNAARLMHELSRIDVRAVLPRVGCPTLVLHARRDAVVPFAQGRELAAAIPGARFVPLDSANHLLLEREPAWGRFLEEVRGFLGVEARPAAGGAGAPPLLAAGRGLGRYRIVERIRAGGMGEVYRARDEGLGRDVAIKTVRLDPDQPERHARLEREAKAVARLSHPHILAVHDVGTTGSLAYIVTELLEGVTLRERMQQGVLPYEEALAHARAIASAVRAAHAKGIVHRDLKPENVFLPRDGALKVLDFGLALTIVAPAAGPVPDPQRRLTQPGVLSGTVAYMSPEQLQDGPVDHRADVFAFGVLLYEMLTGAHPFRRPTSAETLAAILRDAPPAPGRRIPGPLERVLARCLAKEARLRFQSMEEVEAALADATSQAGPLARLVGRLRRTRR